MENTAVFICYGPVPSQDDWCTVFGGAWYQKVWKLFMISTYDKASYGVLHIDTPVMLWD